MLTIFTAPRAFEGPVAWAQGNAIGSWALLDPRPRIVIFGDESGIGKMADEVAGVHIPRLTYSPSGAPKVDEMFRTVAERFSDDVLCYVNADIILLPDFVAAIDEVAARLHSYLVIGRRIDVDLGGPVDLQRSLVRAVSLPMRPEAGRLTEGGGTDYFAYSPGDLPSVPPFALGRGYWDNWLIADALRRRLGVVDATEAVTALHQIHGYEHVKVGATGTDKALQGVYRLPEANENLRLAGGLLRLRTVGEATHFLSPTPNGPRLRRAGPGRRSPGFEAPFPKCGVHPLSPGWPRLIV